MDERGFLLTFQPFDLKRAPYLKELSLYMARITVEDCLRNCENRFALVHIATKRTRDLYKGVDPLIYCKNREVVTSLREIAAGKIKFTGEAWTPSSPPSLVRSSKKAKRSRS